MGYIQDGPLGPFGPTGIAPGGLQGGQKWPKNAIKRAFMAISGTGGSKWLDLSGSWLDLGGIHPGWSVGAIWTHRNCPGGLQGGQKCPKNAIKRAFMAISGISGPKIIVFAQKSSFAAKSGSSRLKWVEHRSNWVEHYISHPGWLVETF